MAFDLSNLTRDANFTEGALVPRGFYYSTSDSHSTVEGAGYFPYPVVRQGDIILATMGDTNRVYVVASDRPPSIAAIATGVTTFT